MMETYNKICNDLLSAIECNMGRISDTLVEIETLKMANDEIERSISVLKNIEIQEEFLKVSYKNVMSSFLPLNQPLYSLVLQVILPSLVLKRVFYRPPSSQVKLHKTLYNVFSKLCPNIEICTVSRRLFLDKYISQSKIVNFTGQYANALSMLKCIPKNSFFIYNGSAINPVIVDKDADLRLASDDLIHARLYNSGQDCMAPACIFVNKKIADNLLFLLKERLSCLRIGKNEEPDNDIGPLISKESFNEYLEFKKKYRNNLVYGGSSDKSICLVEPAIFYFNTIMMELQKTYFAPYFIIMGYSDLSEIKQYLNSEYCEKYSGYISLYGREILGVEWYSGKKRLIQLNNATLYTEEDGNKEFGGYGSGCNFIYKNGVFRSEPILLLREIKHLLEDE